MTTQNNKFVASFILRQSKNNKESGLIYLRISLNAERLEISAKQHVNLSDWDKIKECIKGKSVEIQKANIILERLKENAFMSYRDLSLEQKPFSIYDIKNKMLGIGIQTYTLIEMFEYHKEYAKITLATGTLKNYKTTQAIFQSFLKDFYKKKDMFLSELNYKFLKDFEKYIYKRNTIVERGMQHNALTKHIVRLRKIVRVAIENEWLPKDPFTAYKINYTKTNREFLTQLELESIENKEFPIKRLEKIKDLFIFSCYTGLAYIDAQNLTKDNICFGIDGELWLKTQRAKTETNVTLPLLPQAKKIIAKYQNDPVVNYTGKLLPKITNERLNAYLKEVAVICGINKVLTTHMARHTFATTVTLTNGVPIETVSKMLGHTSIKTTQIYAKVIDSKISSDMKILQQKLDAKTEQRTLSIAL